MRPTLILACIAVSGGGWAADPTGATKADGLLAQLPKDAWPAAGKDGLVERKACEEWMRKNLVGRTVEWTAKIESVKIPDSGDKLKAALMLEGQPYSTDGGMQVRRLLPFDKKLDAEILWKSDGAFGLCSFVYSDLSSAEAKRIRETAGESVQLRSYIRNAHCLYDSLKPFDQAGRTPKGAAESHILIVVDLVPPMLNGFVPAKLKAIYK